MTLRVALRISRPQAWMGGANYLLNICRILRAHAPDVEPVLFAPEGLGTSLERLIAASIGGAAIPIRERSRREDNLAMIGIAEHRSAATFAAADVDLVFESTGYYGPRPPFPVLSWLPDFQHRRLPHLFTRPQWWAREARFRRILATRPHVLLSSESAREDMERFYGRPKGTVHVVPFAVRPERATSWDEGEQVRKAHDLPERYLFLPNQFWVHKNHRVVVEALGMLGADAPTVAATGNPHDPRAPTLVDELRERAAALGVGDRFRMLGQVPYADLLALNARADRLVNPSLFEGWSTTVEEAKALGTPLVLSDIDVHREQAPAGTIFFRSEDPQDCARALRDAVAGGPRAPGASSGIASSAEAAEKRFAARLSDAFRSAARAR